MLPASAESLETDVKMLAIIEQRDVVSGCHIDNTDKYLLLMLCKLGLDTMALYLCCRKLHTSFLCMCSLSILLADLVMVVSLVSMWFHGPERYLVSVCFLLAKASATYEALPSPIMCLGLLDYYLDMTSFSKQSTFCKFLRNAFLTLLVWTLAVTYSFVYVNSDLMELDRGSIQALVCEVRESDVIGYFVFGLFTALICTMLPFWSMIPQWVKEADRLCEAREEKEKLRSDLLFTLTKCEETKGSEETKGGEETKGSEENNPEETVQLCPPLWFSLTLGFSLVWMPYLTVSVACKLFGFVVPAYITVNLLWLGCTNSVLSGVVFWANSKTKPYSQLPENVCLWHIYWKWSKGKQQQQLPIAVFNPLKGKRNTLLYV